MKPCICVPPKEKPEHLSVKYKRLHNIWRSMRQRCYYPKRKDYHSYGGRGIKICDEWRNSFKCFADWALNNEYSDTLTLDRINNDGDYCPENCRWATRREQDHNRSNVKWLFVVDGEEYTIHEICEKLMVNPKQVIRRMKNGEEFDDAFNNTVARRKVPWDGKKERERRNERRKLNRAKKKLEKEQSISD